MGERTSAERARESRRFMVGELGWVCFGVLEKETGERCVALSMK